MQSLSAQLRQAQQRYADLQGQLAGQQEALGASGQESAQLHKALRSLDAERDALQVSGRGAGV